MSEGQDSQIEPEGATPPKKSFWPIVGWAVIGVMIMLILLNVLGWVPPEVNRVSLPGLVIVYLVYVIFRRRNT